MTLNQLQTFGDPESMVGARLSVLLKGHSGTGKTRTALTFPQPIYLIYTDVNRETVRKMAQEGVKIQGVAVRSWAEFADLIIPHIVKREIDAQTIVVDTIDFLSDLMWRDIEGSRGRLSMQDFGTGLRRLGEVTRALAACTSPHGDHPGYHVVFTSHLKDVTDDSGALLKVAPAIMGQFTNKIEDYFDYVLLMHAEAGRQIIDGVNTPTKKFLVYSVPPDRFQTCKGGGMPPVVEIAEGQSGFEVMNEFWQVEAPGGESSSPGASTADAP